MYGQRLAATGADVGGDFRISTVGNDGDASRDAGDVEGSFVPVAASAYGSGPNEYLVVWSADDLAANDEIEIFGRLIGKPSPPATTPPGTTPVTKCKKAKEKKKKCAAPSKKKKKKGCKKIKKKRK